MVSDAKYIQFQLYADPQRYRARVLYVSHESDLALIEPEDPAVLEGIKPVVIGELPETLEEVLVYGYPLGGNTLSITKGVLSRIEFQTYVHSSSSFLAGQIDAAINPGNSGGPVIVDRKVVGISMQKRASGGVDNIGYMIPSPMIQHFLSDVEDGQYDGFPLLGINYQQMESPSLRRKFQLKDDQSGVLVAYINWDSPTRDILQEGDVILAINGYDIANDGTVEFREKTLISFAYYVQMVQIGETVTLRVLRDGDVIDKEIRLAPTERNMGLVLSQQYEREPSFFIFGGLVFMPLSADYLCTWKNCNAPSRLMAYLDGTRDESRREVVVLTRVLPSAVNEGYHGYSNFVVETVNGNPYADFREFHRLVAGSDAEFVTFADNQNVQVVIDREEASETHENVLETYGISRDHSPDLVQ